MPLHRAILPERPARRRGREPAEIVERQRMRMVSSRLLAAALIAPLISLATPAAAGQQLRATHRPRAAGPLVFEGRNCGVQKVRGAGVTVAVGRSCIFLYTFSATAELDPLRDYGVAWVQTELDVMNDWCATAVGAGIFLPDHLHGHARAPAARAASSATRVTTVLPVDAEGNALTDASVRQSFILQPQRLHSSLSRGRRALVVRWEGRTDRPLAFAAGLEFSSDATASLLGRGISFNGGLVPPLRFERRRTC
jgi:hypothetical protein